MTLLEAVLATVIVAVLLVVAMNCIGSLARGRQIQTTQWKGHALAHQLLTEVVQARYEDPADAPVFGPEIGEGGGSRQSLDDVDDYHGWTSEPQDKDGVALAGFTGWQRSVVVQYVRADDVSAVVAGDEGLKRITVTVADPQGRQCVLSALRSSAGVYEQSPGGNGSHVSGVQVRLQIGSSPADRVSAGVDVHNRVGT